ncbi:cytochrome P450 [Lipomyces arxii]|uniref:cytochrome P450 n=1 Tax=Lipomyces arxii TaxID=56418 RepID=UPI0034CE7728
MVSAKLKFAWAGIFVYVARKTVLQSTSFTNLGLLWLAIVVVPGLVRFIYNITLYNRFFSPYRDLPVPIEEKSSWLWGHLDALHNSNPGILQLKWMEQHRDAKFVRYFGMLQAERLIPLTPAALQTILMTESYSFTKSELTRRSLKSILGDGIINAEGDSHRRQRKLLNPSFTYGHVKSLTPIFMDKATTMVNKMSRILDESATAGENKKLEVIMDINTPVHATTLDIIFKAGFGADFDAIENPDNELVQAYRRVFSMPEFTALVKIDFAITILTGIPGVLPTARNRQFKESKKIIENFSIGMIREKQEKRKIAATFKKSEAAIDKDIISTMITEGKGAWTEKEILNNLMTFLAAGHETTSNATAFALFHLSRNPEIQSKLREEIRTVLPNGHASLPYVTYDQIDKLKYLNNFCKESLRVSPPVPATTREAEKDVMVDGIMIKKGTLLFVQIYGVNHSKAIWGEDADEFKPERWDSLPTEAISPYSLLTFLQGPRSCIGRRFAEVEFKALLIALISTFNFAEREPGENHKIRTAITTRFVDGLPLRVSYAE